MESKQWFTRTAALALVLSTCACVLSVDEVVPASRATFDARLVGSWISADSTETAVIARGDSGAYAIDYTKRASTGGGVVEDGKTGHFEARLGTLGAHQVLDVWPTPRDHEIPSAYDGAFIAGHILLVLDIRADSFVTRALEPDTLFKALRAGRIRAPYSGSKDQVILRGSTQQVRALLVPYLAQAGVLTEANVFHRVRASTAGAPPVAERLKNQ